MKNDLVKSFAAQQRNVLFAPLLNNFCPNTVTGKVTDSKDGIALNGVTVSVKGATTAIQTNSAGNFSIQAPSGSTLVFSSVNYDGQEVAVDNQLTVNVQLTATAGKLNEVVVIGYGTSRKKALTGN